MAKLLLVEDDNNLREIYQARLMAEGYDIVAAQDGEEALVMAKKEKPDLIISDVMMPRISGFEMLDILRNTEGLRDTKIIMLTALSQNEDQNRADKLGADKYLVKSQVTLEDIVKSAKQLLGETVDAATPPTASAEPSSEPAAKPASTVAEIPVAVEPAATPAPAPVAAVASASEPAAPVAAPEPATPAPEPAVPTVATPPAPAAPVATPDPVAPAPEPVADPAPAVATPPAPAEPVVVPAPEPEPEPEPAPTPAPAPAPEPTPEAEAEPAAEPAVPSPAIEAAATTPAVEPAAPASVVEPAPADESEAAEADTFSQSLAAEEKAIEEQIQSFEKEPGVDPVEATPQTTSEAAAEANDTAVLENAVEELNSPEPAPEPALPPSQKTPEETPAAPAPAVIAEPAPQQEPAPAPEPAAPAASTAPEVPAAPATPPAATPSPSATTAASAPASENVTVAGKKVIKPLNDNLSSGPKLEELLAKEAANTPAAPPAPVVGNGGPNTPPPAQPGAHNGLDPTVVTL